MEFIWPVAEDGYEVVEAVGIKAEEKPGTPLADHFISARKWQNGRQRFYDPFTRQHRALPRHFAELSGTAEIRFVEFANQYGTLGDAQSYFIERSPGDGHYSRLAEPLSGWIREAEALACAFGLLD